jgi:hypothetical protein
VEFSSANIPERLIFPDFWMKRPTQLDSLRSWPPIMRPLHPSALKCNTCIRIRDISPPIEVHY